MTPAAAGRGGFIERARTVGRFGQVQVLECEWGLRVLIVTDLFLLILRILQLEPLGLRGGRVCI